MDVYIPDDLFIKNENQDKVQNLLEQYFGSDIDAGDLDNDKFFEDLEKLNEPKVFDYLKEQLYDE